MNQKFSVGMETLMSETSARVGVRIGRVTVASLVIPMLLVAGGCASKGSDFGAGGSAGTTGGATSSSGGTNNTGGTAPSPTGGNGGSDTPTGGGGGTATQGGSGGDTAGADSTGGTATGSGGAGATGGSGGATGGAAGAGTGGGSGSSGSGGSSVTPTDGGSVVPDSGTGPACPKPAGQICHEFYANDNSTNNELKYVNEFEPAKSWSVNVGDTGANSGRTIEIVDNPKSAAQKAVLVSVNKGYAEFDVVDGKVLARVNKFSNVTGAVRLPDGTTALAADPNLLIVTATGGVNSTYALPAGADLRALNRSSDGHYWISKYESLYELSATGQQLWTAKLPAGGKGYAVFPRVGGGAWATTGYLATVVELDKTGAVQSTIGKTAPGANYTNVNTNFWSGFHRLANGNCVVANWFGHITDHASIKNEPEILEITPQNKLVWQWGNQSLALQITNVYVVR